HFDELTISAKGELGSVILREHQLLLLCVRFVHAPDRGQMHYQKFFASEVRFSQAYYGIELDIQGLAHRSEQADPMLLQLLVHQAEQAIAAKPSLENLMEQAQQMIAEQLRTRHQ